MVDDRASNGELLQVPGVVSWMNTWNLKTWCTIQRWQGRRLWGHDSSSAD